MHLTYWIAVVSAGGIRRFSGKAVNMDDLVRHMIGYNNGLAVKDLVNETLRQYGYAFGVANAKGGINSGTGNRSDPGMQGAVANISAYQSAQALALQSQGMLTQAKSVIPTNPTSATKAAVAKIGVDLPQLKKTIDEKNPYDKVASLVQKTIYPDIDAAFHLK